MSTIYLGTVLLEKNRWSSRIPSIRVSEWIPRIRQAGFDGLELWENHVLKVPGELEAIEQSAFPVSIFNTYIVFDKPEEERYQQTAAAIRALRAPAIKYNFGTAPIEPCRERLLHFADMLPEGCQLLCECHPDTVLEEADVAARFHATLPLDRFGAIMHGVGKVEEVIARYRVLKPYIRHIHMQTTRQDKEGGNLAACVNALLNEGFSGTWTIEFTHTSQKPLEENTEEAWGHAIDDLRALRALL
nr:hypothetical protein [bacterium]